MNHDQAGAVLDALVAGFRTDLSDSQVESWMDAIQDCGADPDKAQEIAYRWPRTHDRFPSMAEFLTVIAPRQNLITVDPDDHEVDLGVQRRIVRMWRDSLVEVDKRVRNSGATKGVDGHWHGGPDPCPVCGGIAPRAARR